MKSPHLEQSVIDTIPSGTKRLLVAVSGGVDSVVLLHILCSLIETLNLSLEVAHLDHQIRRESATDAGFVTNLCSQWSVPCHIESSDVPALAEQNKVSLEMAGRQARREFLQRIAGEISADLIALGHHQDDQVETFLLRLLRGSGQNGLAAMKILQGCWWRPLLESRRAEILLYAQHHELSWVEDQSNSDPAFLRNKLRGQIIPQLLEINPLFSAGINRLTHQIQVDEDYWEAKIETRFPTFVQPSVDGLRLKRSALSITHPALRIRLLREALLRVRGDLQAIEAVHLQAVDGLLMGSRSQAQLDLPGCWVACRYDSLWIRSDAPEKLEPFDFPLIIGGEVELPSGQVVRLSLGDEMEGESTLVAEFSLSALTLPLRIRSWQPGDRFEPQGMVGHKRLKRFFSDNRIELEDRFTTPLLVCGETILWVVGLRRSRHAIVNHDGGSILRVELLK